MTRSRVRLLAGRVPLMTCETVVTETPASRATSAMVTTARRMANLVNACERTTRRGVVRKRLRASACGRSVEDVHPVVREVTARISQRSANSRSAYLERIRAAAAAGPARGDLGCANLAHGIAACGADEKLHLRAGERRNVAIVSAYNDMLSAHQPLERYPAILKKAVLQAGGVAQFAGGVPAMCDGITQGRAGMELSLFSRDVVAMSTAVALSHDMFDGALMLGVCDKIVPGLLIGALTFGHLPTVFVPAGPMPSGPAQRARRAASASCTRRARSAREELLDAELASYHSPGTCTFYGTANSNQLVVEAMGLHLPGRELRQPGHAAAPRADRGGRPRRDAGLRADRRDRRRAHAGQRRRRAAGHRRLDQPHDAPRRGRRRGGAAPDLGRLRRPLGGRPVCWPASTPTARPTSTTSTRRAASPFVIGELLDAGLMHPDVETVAGFGLGRYRDEPYLDDGGRAALAPRARASRRDGGVLRPVRDAFAPDGGIRVLDGALGRAVMKVSAVAPEHRVVTAPARVFDDQARLPRRLRPRRAGLRPRRGRAPPGPARERDAGAAQAHARRSAC